MALELIALIVFVAACSSGPKGPGRTAWNHARTVAETYLQQKYGAPPAWRIESEQEGTPFLFRVDSPAEFAVLVHRDAVFTQKGRAGLDRYLRESRCVEQRTTNLEDMTTLLQLLDALPEDEQHSHYVTRHSTKEAWRPRLDFLDGGRAELHLFYIVQETGEEPSDGDNDETSLIEWTLTMDPGQMPVWRKQPRTWNKQRKAFVDVDHAN